MKKRLLLICFILFYYHAIFAQLHIAKDNINCLYGLKNENNKWILKPTYTYIDEVYRNSSVFQVFDGQYRGIISAEDGKVIIPCCQDRFDISFHYFLGYKNEKIMVYNRDGKPLTQQIYDQITPYAYSKDYLWCYKNFPDSVLTSLMQVDVGFLFHDVNGLVREWRDSTYTIIQDNRDISYMNLGIIDSVGKIILPKKYNEIEIKKGYFIAKQKDTVLFLNNKNELILEPFATIKIIQQLNNVEKFIVIKYDTSCSLINGKLQTIIPFKEYDKIDFVNSKTELILVAKNRKYGIIDSHGKVIIPIIYNKVKPVNNQYYYANHYYYYGDSSTVFLCELNGKYGLLNEQGKALLDFKYELISKNYSGNYNDELNYLKYGNDIYFINHDCKMTKYTFLFNNEFGSFYNNNISVICLKKYTDGKERIITNYSKDGIFVSGDHFFISVYIPTGYNNYEINVYDYQGNSIYPNQLKAFYRNGFYLPNTKINEFGPTKFYSAIYAVTKSKRLGLYSYYSGKLLVDTLYSSIISSSSLFYNSNNINLICKKYFSNQYDIYDTLGTIVKTINCDTIYQDQNLNYKKVAINGKMGIINNNYDWLIKPQYKYIEFLTEHLFLVINHNKKVGIIDVNNKLIVDTAYTDFLPVFNNYHPNFFATNDTINGFTAAKKEQWWLLKNSNERILVNDKGKSIKSYSSSDSCFNIIQNMLLKFAFNGAYMPCSDGFCDYSFINSGGSHNIADGALKITMIKEDKDFLLKQTYINQLFDILEKAYSNEIKILKNYSNPTLGFTTDSRKILKNVLHKEIYSFGKSYVSLYINDLSLSPDSGYYSNDYYNKYNYDNYIFVNGKLNIISFSEVFKNDDFFRTEIMEAIKKDEDLKLDCTDMSNIYQKINGRYALTKDGVNLFIEDENYDLRAILIPKHRLNANKGFNWLIPYLR
ncbi:MAG: WG repeat-containing protein [Burkholderiales bacterium]|nr:WG repeat-containing protein [Bacteroidia bacterium]